MYVQNLVVLFIGRMCSTTRNIYMSYKSRLKFKMSYTWPQIYVAFECHFHVLLWLLWAVTFSRLPNFLFDAYILFARNALVYTDVHSKCILLWVFKIPKRVKVLWHVLHSYTLVKCFCLCAFKAFICVKLFPHRLHICGRLFECVCLFEFTLPICLFSCACKVTKRVKVFSQNLQMYGLSLRCVCLCKLKSPNCMKVSPHTWHLLKCIFLCVFKVHNCAKVLWHKSQLYSHALLPVSLYNFEVCNSVQSFLHNTSHGYGISFKWFLSGVLETLNVQLCAFNSSCLRESLSELVILWEPGM